MTANVLCPLTSTASVRAKGPAVSSAVISSGALVVVAVSVGGAHPKQATDSNTIDRRYAVIGGLVVSGSCSVGYLMKALPLDCNVSSGSGWSSSQANECSPTINLSQVAMMSSDRLALPAPILVDAALKAWLLEDIGRGDRATEAISGAADPAGTAVWVAKEAGIVAGVPLGARVLQLLDPALAWEALVAEGAPCQSGQTIARFAGKRSALLSGERVALNLGMRLSGVATHARQFVEAIADLPAQFVDTRKTTPGLRILEKYATRAGGARNHRMGLDDAAMIKDNHIAAAGGILPAIAAVRAALPYPLSIEVETTTLAEVREALAGSADIIMLDNMPSAQMREAVAIIRQENPQVKIEASGNVTLETIRDIALAGPDYISSSAPVTRAPWLDLSMRYGHSGS